mmetsp:Transcript_37302/g.94065  ORF Transcript_37302/g.94065 Transcript_37302/m.94065 type:complete len:204 (-) Transcript_37302:564-1175(-)
MAHNVAQVIVEQAAEQQHRELEALRERSRVSIRITLRRRFCWTLRLAQMDATRMLITHAGMHFHLPRSDTEGISQLCHMLGAFWNAELHKRIRVWQTTHVQPNGAPEPEHVLPSDRQAAGLQPGGAALELEDAERGEERAGSDTEERLMWCASNQHRNRILVTRGGRVLLKVHFTEPGQVAGLLGNVLGGLRHLHAVDDLAGQ